MSRMADGRGVVVDVRADDRIRAASNALPLAATHPGGQSSFGSETMRVTIDGAQIRTHADLHNALGDLLDFGPYYGHNLNAL